MAYSHLWDDPGLLRDIVMSTKPSPNCHPCYLRGYDPRRRPWFLQRNSDLPIDISHGIESSFYRNYTGFEVESPRDLETFYNTDFFASTGVCARDTYLGGALTVRVFIGAQHQLEFVHPKEVERYLNSLLRAKLSSGFKLRLLLWAEYDASKFGCICPVGSRCTLRRQNEEIADNIVGMLEGLEAFGGEFGMGDRRSVQFSVGIAGEGDAANPYLKFDVPDPFHNNMEAWLTVLRHELYSIEAKRQRPFRA
ncbi:hypothetical protein EJ02DRAFT_458603 [Clathrospora elynae]|uniref:Uncharacterized protein n=1 Tax=Clathrospora elynae TaxID=706981 RepID=A0A6A5SAC0_9PLEO|nr:hypothetical protein EJ02DRAFT_458603 [Clathrospora elynae]